MVTLNRLKIGVLVLLTFIITTGFAGPCAKKHSSSGGDSGSSGGYTITNGSIQGIGSYTGLIYATITCSPNSGTLGTPVTYTITFSSGGSYINDIKVYQRVPYGSYIYTPDCDPVKQSANVWIAPNDIFLTGNAAWVKFSGVDGSASEICLGVIEVNDPVE